MAGGKLEVQIGADITDFEKKIKEIEYDIKELSKVKLERLKVGLDTSEINAQIKDAKNSLNSLKSTVKDTGGSFTGLTPKVANGGNALLQFSRIAQDAPFGIIGIGNNLTATAEAFASLKNQTGSTGGALKALASSLTGTGGLLLGVSLLTTGFTLLAQSGLSVGDVIAKITGNFDEFTRSLQKANEEAAKTSGSEIANMKALVSVAQDDTLSREKRLIAVKDLQKEFPAYFGNLTTEKILNGDLTTVTKELTAAIVARAKASAYSAKIGELSLKEVQLNNQLANEIYSIAKAYNLSKSEAKTFKEEVLKGADVFKLLEPFKKRVGIFDLAGAVASSNAIKDIRKDLIQNAAWQQKYTDKINDSTKAYINLNKETPKVVKPPTDKTHASFEPQFIAPFLGTISGLGSTMDGFEERTKIAFQNATGIVKTELSNMEIAAKNFVADFNDLFDETIKSGLGNLGTSIGEALATGSDVLKAVGNSLLQTFAGFLSSLGDQIIALGIAAVAAGTVLKTIGTISGIGAGVAAIAAGVIVKALAGGIASSARGGMRGGNASTASGSGANNSSFTSSGFSSANGGGTVVFEISGQKLIGVLSNTINANKRLGGQLGLG